MGSSRRCRNQDLAAKATPGASAKLSVSVGIRRLQVGGDRISYGVMEQQSVDTRFHEGKAYELCPDRRAVAIREHRSKQRKRHAANHRRGHQRLALTLILYATQKELR